MNLQIVMCVLTSAVLIVRGQTSLGKCTRPDGNEGLCITYEQCPEILEQLLRRTKSSKELINYSCGFQGRTPKVCCNYDCYTPEGKLGNCKPMTTCPHLKEMYEINDSNANAYVRNSRCLTGPNDVCCGPPPAPEYSQSAEDCVSQLSAFPPHPSSMCCGYDAHAVDKIIGGSDTGIDEYPWLALLEYRKKGTGDIGLYCGGTLISNRYVLTAAHCIKGNGAWPPINVRLGEFDTSTDHDCVEGDCADPVVTIAIDDIITHPRYDPITDRNDIALLRLARPVTYTDFIRPICLPQSDVTYPFIDGMKAYVAGWGRVNLTLSRSKKKQHVKLPIVSIKDCQAAYDRIRIIPAELTSSQVCAGGEEGKDSCTGDSGGPLMTWTNLLYELAGVVSYGPRNCGTKGLPGIYTNVHAYSTWIWRSIRP